MGVLFDFLIARKEAGETKEIRLSGEFPAPITIQSIDQDTFEEVQKRCKIRNKKGDVIDFNNLKFSVLVVAEACIEPNFKNAEALKQAGCVDGESFIKKYLKPGEIAELYKQISALSGFDVDPNEAVEEAKN